LCTRDNFETLFSFRGEEERMSVTNFLHTVKKILKEWDKKLYNTTGSNSNSIKILIE
jgi:hypothetical protein